MKIYNSVDELSGRVLILLNSINSSISAERISIYDYFSIHLNDLNSLNRGLHPNNPNHCAEIIVRQQSINEALKFLLKKGLIRINYTDEGFTYNTNKYASSVINMFICEYSTKYMACVKQVDDYFRGFSDNELNLYVLNNIKSNTTPKKVGKN